MISITEHVAALTKNGVEVISGSGETFWVKYETSAMVRVPKSCLTSPSLQEVRRVLWRGRVAVASYLLEPDGYHPANAYLYLCTDHTYALEKLPPAVRRNVRRGLRELSITPLTSEQLLAHGFPAFRDTRSRNGLSDGTIEEFQRRFTCLVKLPGVVYLGAWKNEHLAGFVEITEVDDWAELGCFSMDALLQYRPNDTLIYSVLSYYLVERKSRLVSYGLSSVQTESSVAGLHRFKVKLGFEACPVHRAFVPHPLLGPLINPLTLWGVRTMLRLKPEDRRLRKAQGALGLMRGDTHMMELARGEAQ